MTISKVELETLKQNLVGGAIDFLKNGFDEVGYRDSVLLKRFKEMSEVDALAEIDAACECETGWDCFWIMFKEMCENYTHK